MRQLQWWGVISLVCISIIFKLIERANSCKMLVKWDRRLGPWVQPPGGKKLLLGTFLIKGTSAAVFATIPIVFCCSSGSINILVQKARMAMNSTRTSYCHPQWEAERNTSITAHSSPEHTKGKLSTQMARGSQMFLISFQLLLDKPSLWIRWQDCLDSYFQVDGAPFRNIYCEPLLSKCLSSSLGQEAQREKER